MKKLFSDKSADENDNDNPMPDEFPDEKKNDDPMPDESQHEKKMMMLCQNLALVSKFQVQKSLIIISRIVYLAGTVCNKK